MTPEQYNQLWDDALYYSVNSDPPKARVQVFGEMVRQGVLKEVRDNNIVLGDQYPSSPFACWLECNRWLDRQLKEAS